MIVLPKCTRGVHGSFFLISKIFVTYKKKIYLGYLFRSRERYLQLDILNNFPDFLLILRFLDKGMQICLISWNLCLVFRFANTCISPLCSLICLTVDMVWGKIAL